MTLPTPYFQTPDGAITLYHGDCRDILPHIEPGSVELVLCDPPYGIGMDKGAGTGGRGLAQSKKKQYTGEWDAKRPAGDLLRMVWTAGRQAIVWGGNYFADVLPVNGKWLVWDKQNYMPSYSDAELAWTDLPGTSVKMFRQSGHGMLAAEKWRAHPTQKPVALMEWCMRIAGGSGLVLDPFAGSGTTLVAARRLGRRAIGIELSEEYCEIAAGRLGNMAPAKEDEPLLAMMQLDSGKTKA